jgi:hypothetical protein
MLIFDMVVLLVGTVAAVSVRLKNSRVFPFGVFILRRAWASPVPIGDGRFVEAR